MPSASVIGANAIDVFSFSLSVNFEMNEKIGMGLFRRRSSSNP